MLNKIGKSANASNKPPAPVVLPAPDRTDNALPAVAAVVWFATFDKGLIKWENNTFSVIDEKKGLPTNATFDIFQDKIVLVDQRIVELKKIKQYLQHKLNGLMEA